MSQCMATQAPWGPAGELPAVKVRVLVLVWLLCVFVYAQMSREVWRQWNWLKKRAPVSASRSPEDVTRTASQECQTWDQEVSRSGEKHTRMLISIHFVEFSVKLHWGISFVLVLLKIKYLIIDLTWFVLQYVWVLCIILFHSLQHFGQFLLF